MLSVSLSVQYRHNIVHSFILRLQNLAGCERLQLDCSFLKGSMCMKSCGNLLFGNENMVLLVLFFLSTLCALLNTVLKVSLFVVGFCLPPSSNPKLYRLLVDSNANTE